jgi:hypothetical protein
MSYSAHALMENRNGLIVDFRVEEANGYAERRTALAMLADHAIKDRRITVAGDAAMTRLTSFAIVAPSMSRRTSRRPEIPDGDPLSTTAQRVTLATSSVNANENSSRRSSAG